MTARYPITRRRFLGTAAGAMAIPAIANFRSAHAETPESAPAAFRFVHFTDSHVQPELNAEKGFAQALEAAQQLDPKPDFILNGGDLVMDVLAEDEKRSTLLFDRYRKLVAEHSDVPVHNCIGNHDVFGWAEPKGVTPKHPKYGKRMVLEQLELPGRYYRFDHKGWRFYVLDSIQPWDQGSYQGYIDDEQLAWLTAELKQQDASTPAVVVTHIPLFSAAGVAFCMDKLDGRVEPNIICRNGHRVGKLLSQYNVPLALSGHIHGLDRIDYLGMTFLCDGAVSGRWWKGPNKGMQEGFGVIDLAADATFKHTYHDYGWEVASFSGR